MSLVASGSERVSRVMNTLDDPRKGQLSAAHILYMTAVSSVF